MYKLLAINQKCGLQWKCNAMSVKELKEKFLENKFHNQNEWTFRIWNPEGKEISLIKKQNNEE